MSRKGETITLSLSVEEKESLEEIAAEFKQFWGDKPNISKLMRALANKELVVNHPNQTVTKSKNIKAAIALIEEGLAKLN